MLPTDRPLLLATHSGTFHADDCLAFCILQRALRLDSQDSYELIRTRDRALLAKADIVWDVGGAADEATWRFDHHQPGAPKAPNGDPLSSAGLVWRMMHPDSGATLGELFVRNSLQKRFPSGGEFSAAAVARMVEAIGYKFVRHVDLVDNGVERAPPSDLTNLVDGYNLTWDAPGQADPAAFEETQLRRFREAAQMVMAALDNQLERERSAVMAYETVVQAWEDCKAGKSGIHPDVLELPVGMPWQRPAFELEMPVLFVLSPDSNGQWKLQAMPAEKGSFANKLDMPAEWAGLEDAALEKVTGVPGAVFVHRNRFLAITKTREAALALARLCLANKLTPAQRLKMAMERKR